jgi:hypothetical protein
VATRQTNRILIWMFGGLSLAAILVTGIFNYLLAPDPRVLVVTMSQDADQADRVQLKHDCGSLPGVSVVPDAGNKDPHIQGRFPVRFKIGDTTPALEKCINAHGSLVRGLLTEGDR